MSAIQDPDMQKPGLGGVVRSLREENGLSQAQLAGQAELSQGYMSQIENDEVANSSASVLFRLAKALNVGPRVLLEAAGYKGLLSAMQKDGGFTVDPGLLAKIASYSRPKQRALLRFLRGERKSR